MRRIFLQYKMKKDRNKLDPGLYRLVMIIRRTSEKRLLLAYLSWFSFPPYLSISFIHFSFLDLNTARSNPALLEHSTFTL